MKKLSFETSRIKNNDAALISYTTVIINTRHRHNLCFACCNNLYDVDEKRSGDDDDDGDSIFISSPSLLLLR
jgi:hypothetical protein